MMTNNHTAQKSGMTSNQGAISQVTPKATQAAPQTANIDSVYEKALATARKELLEKRRSLEAEMVIVDAQIKLIGRLQDVVDVSGRTEAEITS